MYDKILLEGFQGTSVKNHIHGAIRPDQQQFTEFVTAGKGRNDIESRVIHQMQVLQCQNQSIRCCQKFQSFTELANHALPSGSNDFLSQIGLLFRLYGRWKLNQPGRSLGGENLNHGCSFGAAQEPSERVQQWVVWLFAAKALDALAL